MLADKHSEDEEHRTEDRIKLLSPGELKTTLEAEIQNHQRQIQSLKHQLQSIPGSIVAVNSTAEIESVTTMQQQSAISPPPLRNLVEGAKILIQEIAKHPDYLALNYQPDLTVGDAETALSYLESELEPSKEN
jgi:hypothetical protein